MSKRSELTGDQRDELHSVQADACQALLFTMDQLGERSVFLQLEIDGVLRSIAARELAQGEFDDLVREAVSRR